MMNICAKFHLTEIPPLSEEILCEIGVSGQWTDSGSIWDIWQYSTKPLLTESITLQTYTTAILLQLDGVFSADALFTSSAAVINKHFNYNFSILVSSAKQRLIKICINVIILR